MSNLVLQKSLGRIDGISLVVSSIVAAAIFIFPVRH